LDQLEVFVLLFDLQLLFLFLLLLLFLLLHLQFVNVSDGFQVHELISDFFAAAHGVFERVGGVPEVLLTVFGEGGERLVFAGERAGVQIQVAV